MKNIKFSIEELGGKPFFFIFTIIQLTISFILIYISLSINNSINDKLNVVNRIFENKNYYSINSNSMNDLEGISLDNLIKFKNMIFNKKIDVYSVYKEQVPIKGKNISLDKAAAFNEENKEYTSVNALYVNDNYINKIGIDLSEGSFKETDKRYIPVVLGQGYHDIYKINDVIQCSDVDFDGSNIERKLKVIGFAKKGCCVCINGNVGNLINVDNLMIIERNFNNHQLLKTYQDKNKEMNEKIVLFNYFSHSYYDSKDINSVKEVEKFSDSVGLNFKFESNRDKFNNFKKDNMKILIQIRVFAMIILFFTISSIIIVMLNTIMDNMKEYAINMMVGASVRDINLRIIYELIILFMISLISALIVIWKFIKDDIIVLFNFKNILTLTVICAVICLLVSIIPIYKLKKISINSIMKGGE